MRRNKGFTLTELVVAGLLSVVAVVAFVKVDMTRLLLTEQVRNGGAGYRDASIGLAYLIKDLEQSDRAIFPAGTTNVVLLRIPQPRQFNCPVVCAPGLCGASSAPNCPVACTGCTTGVPSACCFDIPANYRWNQYRLQGYEFHYLNNIGIGGTGAAKD